MSGVKGRSGGHNRKSDREKELLGGRKDRIQNSRLPVVSNSFAEFEMLTPESKHIADYFKPILINSGKMGGESALLFHQFCDVAGRWFVKRKECYEKGDYQNVFDKDGNVIGKTTAPWIEQEKDLMKRCLEYMRELTITTKIWGAIGKIADEKPVSKFSGVIHK